MAFLDANVDNRLRERVRGRVIVATTSKIVEFLEDSLNFSYPLYSVVSIPDGYMLVFAVEVDGFLTFDKGSEVRISPELGAFERLQFDPTAFALVKAADPAGVIPAYRGKIISREPHAARYDDDLGDYVLDKGTVYYEKSPGVTATAVFQFAGQQDGGPGRAYFTNVFIPGELYKGDVGYPGFTRIN